VPLARLAGVAALILLGQACRNATPAQELTVASRSDGGRTTLVLRPASGVRINARVLPAVELSDGTVLRLSSDSLTPDSAYFTAPPEGALPAGIPLRGIVRASICREDEPVCRVVLVPLEPA
jgi:hypothetical protein